MNIEEIITMCGWLDNQFYESLKLIEDTYFMLPAEENKAFTEKYEELLLNAKKDLGDNMFPKATQQLNHLKLEILI